jgi:transposase-like protein
MSQGSRAEKERKRRAVAFAVVAGRGTKATARDIGCSKRYVRHLAAEPETRFLITEILRPYHATLLELSTQ